eukprot:2791283-Amphidinium_carterae.1
MNIWSSAAAKAFQEALTTTQEFHAEWEESPYDHEPQPSIVGTYTYIDIHATLNNTQNICQPPNTQIAGSGFLTVRDLILHFRSCTSNVQLIVVQTGAQAKHVLNEQKLTRMQGH